MSNLIKYRHSTFVTRSPQPNEPWGWRSVPQTSAKWSLNLIKFLGHCIALKCEWNEVAIDDICCEE